MRLITLPALPVILLLCAAGPVHKFQSLTVAPGGAWVAAIEGDEDASGTADIQTVVIRRADGGAVTTLKLPCGRVHDCTPSSPAWTRDGSRLAFVLRSPGSHARAIYTVKPDGTGLTRLLAFNGTLDGLRYGPGGRMSVLATANAAKEVGAVEAGAALTGELGSDPHEQRLAIVQPDGTLHWASPPELYVYEYDWKPDGSGFVGTAAPGDGDNNWWVAKLYAFDAATGAAKVLHAPSGPQEQLDQPAVSPDGHSVSYIGGLMSDFGATGGDAFVLDLDRPAATPVNLTLGWPATITSLAWSCDGGSLMASALRGDKTEIVRFFAKDGAGKPETLVSVPERLQAENQAVSSDCGTGLTASVHQDFTRAPEIEVGKLGQWHDLTHVNDGQTVAATAQSIDWTSQAVHAQGWLLLPRQTEKGGADKGRGLPMVTEVHGGPAWASQPEFVGPGLRRKLLEAGYAVFLPNPRGSFGQGEPFTRMNVKDFGYGDLHDILAGITAAEGAAHIDDTRLGLTGWSYGGYMTMFAVTQTQRFKAAVAGAGIADWQSYYGENGIDAWMVPYFGASVYDAPDVYAKSSPMTFIRQVRTPTLAVVGENDIECPAPQTEEFWHALHDLGVPTSAVIYPGEGHRMHDPAHIEDYQRRAVGWFDKYLRK
jgi:dipeptidyl aminopeptidase/acylaminoacyl peptidase